MVNEIWTKAWLQQKGGSSSVGGTPGSGASSAVTHQTDGIQQMTKQKERKDAGSHGQGGISGGAGSAHDLGQSSPAHSTTKGTGGTPAGTGGSKHQIPV